MPNNRYYYSVPTSIAMPSVNKRLSRYGSASPSIGDSPNMVVTPYPRTPFRNTGTRRRISGKDDYFYSREVYKAKIVKTPSDPDILILNSDILPAVIQFKLVFEDIGGHEILNVSRHDLINGQKIAYQPIQNISSIASQFAGLKLVELGAVANEYFNNFKLQFEDYIPNVGNGANGEYIYIDDDGNVIIDVVNITDEEVEVQIMSNVDDYIDTDYANDGGMS